MRRCMILLGAVGAVLAGQSCGSASSEKLPPESLEELAVAREAPSSPDSVVLVFVGDAMQHTRQLEQARLRGRGEKPFDYEECYTLISPAIEEADYAVVNLELPLGGGVDYSGYPLFSAPDEFAAALRNAGFDLFLTANNHCLDRRDRGLRRTLAVLDSLGVDHIGTYNNASERAHLVPFVKEINGIKLGFLNYTYGTNGLSATDGAEVAYIDRDRMREEIKATREAGADIIVVMPHWGVEYVLTENGVQRSLAEFLVGAGADIVIGGHPHVVEPMKVMTDSATGRNCLVVYSLGNFISDMKTADTRGGAMVRVVVRRDSSTSKPLFAHAEYDTFVTEVPTGRNKNFRVVPRWALDSLPPGQERYWTAFNSSAQRIFDRHNVNVPRSNRR